MSLEERLKQNTKVHSVKGERGGEKRRGEGREGREREKKRKEREREGRRGNVDKPKRTKKKLTSFSCRGKNI